MNSRLTPDEPFPDDLAPLPLEDVEVLNSKLQRELTYEYVHDGEVDPETESRSEEIIEELERRDDQDLLRLVHPHPAASTAAADGSVDL